MKYAVEIDGDILVWEDGQFKSDNKELLDRIREIESEGNVQISLDGSILYSRGDIKPSSNWALSYGFLQGLTGGRMKFVAGDRPTWEKLGYKLKEGEIP